MRIDRPLVSTLAGRFELPTYRQTVFECLRAYNRASLQPVLGKCVTGVLDGMSTARIETAEEGLVEPQEKFGGYNAVLEKYLLVLFALYIG